MRNFSIHIKNKQQWEKHINKTHNILVKNLWKQIILKMSDIPSPTLICIDNGHAIYIWEFGTTLIKAIFDKLSLSWYFADVNRIFLIKDDESIDELILAINSSMIKHVMEI